MSRPKTAGAYPTFMLDILDRLDESPGEALEIKFPSEREALSFRLDFYGFRSCAVKEGMESMYKDLKAIEVKVAKDGTLTFSHKDRNVTAKLIAQALLQPPPSTKATKKELK